MKKVVVAICVSFCGMVFAAPKFVTPSMTKRNGLTDEQYERLWAIGRNPRIEQAAAREWIFRASRYTNVVEWLDECGRTNDFARLSHKLQAENFDLVESNKVLKAEAKLLKDIEKAARKDGKNLAKLRKDLEKYRDKAETPGFRELCEILLTLLPVPN